jgi:hypothetical protein
VQLATVNLAADKQTITSFSYENITHLQPTSAVFEYLRISEQHWQSCKMKILKLNN